MPFPQEDAYWAEVSGFIRTRWGQDAAFAAPPEFVDRFPRAVPYDALARHEGPPLDAAVVHKGIFDEIPPALLLQWAEQWKPVFANPVFIVLQPRQARLRLPAWPRPPWFGHVLPLHEAARGLRARPVTAPSARTAILVTTHNRPNLLRQSLTTICRLGAPVLVVDDGSRPEHRAAHSALAREFPIQWLQMPENRGLPAALNAGLAFWLADPEVAWISYFQDDTEVRADALDVLARVQHPVERPLLTGRLDALHAVLRRERIGGIEAAWQRSCPGIHLHAHRDYWQDVLPIPTPYLGAPKKDGPRPGRGADEDFWITCWAPRSAAKRGLAVCAVPGLVRTLARLPEDSTWGSPAFKEPDALPEPVLPPPPLPEHWWTLLAARHPTRSEAELHPHHPEELAGLYHTLDEGSTELEVLQFLAALVCLFKPRRILETGTWQGFGTLTLASAARANGFGRITSLETNAFQLEAARRRLHAHDPRLEGLVDLVNASSLDYLQRPGLEPFDLCFLDSGLEVRTEEFRLLRERGLLAPGGVVLVHDTSPLRPEGIPGGGAECFAGIASLRAPGPEFERLEFPRSRGFILLRHRGESTVL